MPSFDQAVGYLTGSTVTMLALILITGSMRFWVYGYIDKAKDAHIDRLTSLLEQAIANNKTLLNVMETARRGR